MGKSEVCIWLVMSKPCAIDVTIYKLLSLKSCVFYHCKL